MKLKPIIVSLLDTDLYKFNMNQVIFHKHTNLCGEYYFKCRTKNIYFTDALVEEINAQVDHLCTLSFKKNELDYLKSIRFIKNDYVEFLRLWHPIRDYVNIKRDENGQLSVIVRGPLFSAMQFEIYLLEIINEVYFRMRYDYTKLKESAEIKLNEKIKAFQEGKYTFKFAEFGCRRRLSREWEDTVVHRLTTETNNCVGTSNVYLAMKYNLIPIGTYAHEYVQMYQGIDNIPLAYTNHYAMKDWYEEYQISTSSTTNDLRKAFNLGLIRRHAASDKGGNQFVYTINMTMPNKIRTGELTDLQRSCITRLYERFFKKPFTVEKAAMLLKTKGSSASFHLTNFVERGIMATNGEPGKPLSYTILVNPREYPECFIKGEAIQEIGKRLPMKPTGSQHAVAI